VVNAATLFGGALAFRWVDPASMGVWHTLLLASSYLGIVRFGVINGMGRDLPFALGRGEVALGRRLAATTLAFNHVGAALVGSVFLALMPAFWPTGPAWRLALPAIAILNVNTFYLGYLQATFRSDSDFSRLARVHFVQAGMALLLPFLVSAFGFPGLCAHAALQSTVVTAYAHAVRPIPVRPPFQPALARHPFPTRFP